MYKKTFYNTFYSILIFIPILNCCLLPWGKIRLKFKKEIDRGLSVDLVYHLPPLIIIFNVFLTLAYVREYLIYRNDRYSFKFTRKNERNVTDQIKTHCVYVFRSPCNLPIHIKCANRSSKSNMKGILCNTIFFRHFKLNLLNLSTACQKISNYIYPKNYKIKLKFVLEYFI